MNKYRLPESEIRKVEILHIECPACGYKGNTYVLAGDTYGILLGRDSVNNLSVLDSWKDTAFFDEISDLVDSLIPKEVEPELNDCFGKIVGKVCDPSSSGEFYDFTGKKVCPNCKSSNARYFFDEPIKFDNINLPNVSHKKWDTLSSEQKAILLRKFLC